MDGSKAPGRVWRAFSALISHPSVSPIAMRFATAVDGPLLRASRGRVRLSFVIPCLLLRTRGARSGRPREVPLLYVPDGEDLLVVGSGGGSDREPAWCANLRAAPEVECVRSGLVEARVAEELEGNSRSRAWQQALRVYPGYSAYQARLDREIPIFRLSPT